MKADEVFLPIAGYEGWYEVSDYGTVRGVTRVVSTRKPEIRGGVRTVPGRVIVPSINWQGYRRVRLCRETRKSRFMVHRLVLETHGSGPAPDGLLCRHLDGDPSNNFVGNLAWGTATENWDDRRRHGRGVEGEKARNASLTEEKVKHIRTSGMAALDLSEMYGVTPSCIRHVLNNRTWTHVAW